MKTNCEHCINKNSSLCTDQYVCKNFTVKPEFVQQRKAQLINEETKSSLYEHFFYTIRKYLDLNSPYNQYDDMFLYYSIDQNKFLKRHIRNTKEKGNWIELEFNTHHFYNLKSVLGLTDPTKTLSLQGRKIKNNYTWVKDDTWQSFINFTKVTFKRFYDTNRVINYKQEVCTNLEKKSTKLF